MLIAAIVMIFMVLLVLSVAAPRVAKEIQRDREQESARRAQQYVRAVRIFYLKFKRYPTSIEQLEKTNNQRFLRQRYVDPLTGKDDWRLIHVGENQTTVKGFFGDDLPGLPTGLGAAAGMASPAGASSSASTSTSAFGNSTPGAGGAGTPGIGGSATSSFGGSGTFGQSGTQSGGQGATGSGSTANSALGSAAGMASQGGTDPLTGGGGPIIGIGSARSGEAMLVVNEQTSYETWEFLYDPRIEQLYAKGNLLGGISSGSGTGTGLGTSNSLASPGQQNTPVTPIGNTPQTANPPPSGP
jgi:type II secretory pathway pseudopilin PulG